MTTRIELGAGATVADVVARVRAAAGPAVALVVAPAVDPVERALILAAVAPLALERAPGVRVCAVDAGEGADPADIDATVDFLAGALATTGQVLRVG